MWVPDCDRCTVSPRHPSSRHGPCVATLANPMSVDLCCGAHRAARGTRRGSVADRRVATGSSRAVPFRRRGAAQWNTLDQPSVGFVGMPRRAAAVVVLTDRGLRTTTFVRDSVGTRRQRRSGRAAHRSHGPEVCEETGLVVMPRFLLVACISHGAWDVEALAAGRWHHAVRRGDGLALPAGKAVRAAPAPTPLWSRQINRSRVLLFDMPAPGAACRGSAAGVGAMSRRSGHAAGLSATAAAVPRRG